MLWYSYESILAEVMAWCLITPSHYLNHCWIIIRSFPWSLPESNFTGGAHEVNRHYVSRDNTFKITISPWGQWVNTLRPRENGRQFTDDIFKCIFLYENVWIPIWISLKFVPKGPINNIPALVQIMAWGRPGDKPLSEPMMVRLPTHICVTRPQWVNNGIYSTQIYFNIFIK